jgi:hypothetical protein
VKFVAPAGGDKSLSHQKFHRHAGATTRVFRPMAMISAGCPDRNRPPQRVNFGREAEHCGIQKYEAASNIPDPHSEEYLGRRPFLVVQLLFLRYLRQANVAFFPEVHGLHL